MPVGWQSCVASMAAEASVATGTIGRIGIHPFLSIGCELARTSPPQLVMQQAPVLRTGTDNIPVLSQDARPKAPLLPESTGEGIFGID